MLKSNEDLDFYIVSNTILLGHANELLESPLDLKIGDKLINKGFDMSELISSVVSGDFGTFKSHMRTVIEVLEVKKLSEHDFTLDAEFLFIIMESIYTGENAIEKKESYIKFSFTQKCILSKTFLDYLSKHKSIIEKIREYMDISQGANIKG